jgi:ADP-ribose pyrophosphatase YjhB (NUDIX family)
MTDGWLSAQAWATVQASVPVMCVDILVCRPDRTDTVGLILRPTPHQGPRWALVGGRLLRDEGLDAAVDRQWREAFGPSFVRGRDRAAAPLVVEYARTDHGPGPHDPRQHAISTTFLVDGHGEPHVHGTEALDFRWATLDDLRADPPGFGQLDVVERAAALLDAEAVR